MPKGSPLPVGAQVLGDGERMAHYRVIVSGSYSQLEQELRALGAEVYRSATNEAIVTSIPGGHWDACVLDCRHPEEVDWDLIREIRDADNTAVVLIALDRRLGELPDPRVLESGADDAVYQGAERVAARKLAHTIARRRGRTRGGLQHPERHVLLIDWEPAQTAAACGALGQAGYRVEKTRGALTALARLRNGEFGVLFLRPVAKDNELSVVDSALRYDPRLRVVAVSSQPDLSDVLPCLTRGAYDYLLTPVGPAQAVGAARLAWSAFATAAHWGGDQSCWARVLIIDANPGHRQLLMQLLGAHRDIWAQGVETIEQARSDLARDFFDAIVCATDRDELRPLQAVRALNRFAPELPLVLVCDEVNAVWRERAIRLGADELISRERLGHSALADRVIGAIYRFRDRFWKTHVMHDLRRRESSQQEVVQRSLDGMVVVDQRGFVVFANPAAEHMFGVGPGELLGVVLGLDTSTTGSVEVELNAPSCQFAEQTSVKVEWNGSSASLVTLRDITGKRQAQLLREQLAHSERLAAIGQLAAGVTHEINNPAAYVVANLEAMKARLSGLLERPGSDDGLAEFAEMVSESLQGMQRIRTITRDLKNFARIDTEDVQWVDVNECVEAACKITLHEIRQRARLVKELTPVPRICASPGKLVQVITNLLVNAAQAIGETTEDSQIRVSTRSGDETIVLEVEDTGRGVPTEIRERLFDPFFTTKPSEQGTGLGLALCVDILRQHNGRIALSDSSERGSRFEVVIPLDTGLASSKIRPSDGAPLSRAREKERLRLLLVDDEPLVLRSLSRMLSSHEVVAVRGGREALALLDTDAAFDLIVCDLMMPGMDGPELYSHLTTLRPELIKQVVFCSGGAFTPRTKEFVDCCQCPVLQKPLTLDEFDHAVELVSREQDQSRLLPTVGTSTERSS